ncbi:MAG: AMP-binding protein [Acidimicrobiia bacterium]|nr:AMP-binding protein [Acidimicrobiia bacterium]
MPLHEVLAAAPPDDLALVDGSLQWTFADLAAHAALVGASAGAVSASGDRIAVIGHNSAGYVAALYGVPQAGRILTLLNQRLSTAEISQQLDDSGAVAVLGDDALVDAFWVERPTTLRHRLSLLGSSSADPGGAGFDHAGFDHAGLVRVAVDDEQVAWLIFTSGTTGRAKGAMLTHRSLLAAADAAAGARAVASDEVYLYAFPLCHVAAYNVLIQHGAARPVVLVPGFEPERFMAEVEAHRVTATSLAPTMITMLLEHPGFEPDRLASLRRIGYGASPIPEALLRRLDQQLPWVGLSQGYGMTELSGNAVYLDADDHRRALVDAPHLLRAAGRPAPGVELRLGGDSEILVRSDQVMAGYWNRPDVTAEVLVDGWLHTGDMGRVDDDGYLYVVDRKKDIIVTGGENVASREVADVVFAHPDVVEAAVVGVPDPQWGEAVCAVVVGRAGAAVDPDAVIEHCRAHLADYKKPRHVLQVDELPKNAGGKLMNRVVRQWAVDRLEVGGSGVGMLGEEESS